MANALRPNTKRLMIDKANTRMVVVTSVAAFLVVFALVASKTLIGQATYQNRVITADKQALSQLQADQTAVNQLVSSYEAFDNTPQNVLGGNPQGNGSQDGDNAEIALDALPSQYDFPAMAASLEKLLTNQNVQIQSISGTDEELSSASSSANPQPVPMPFELSVTGNYQAIQNLIAAFGESIRPFQIQSVQLSGDEDNMTLTLSAQTYYQPQKVLNISTKVIR